MTLTSNTIPLDLGRTIHSIILDLGDVLCAYNSPPSSPLDSKMLKYIVNSGTYYAYQCGNISKEETYSHLSELYSIPVEHISLGLKMAADSIQVNADLVSFLRELRQRDGPVISIYAMSNIAAPDWETLKSKINPEDLEIFDNIFISAIAHERKPNPSFYKHAIETANLDVEHTLFIDDKRENVATARALGMHALRWSETNTLRQLRSIFSNPLENGMNFLKKNAKQLYSVTEGGTVLHENFTQLLILELINDDTIVNIHYNDGPKLNFFQGKGVLTTSDFPLDNDVMSISPCLRNDLSMHDKQDIMNEILRYRNTDDIILMYWDHSRPRLEPCACINVLTLFHLHGRGDELAATMNFVEAMLTNRAYIEGTYYYPSAEIFLYYLSRLLLVSPTTFKRLGSVFEERIRERFRIPCDTLALAMRVLVAARLFNLVDNYDLSLLINSQNQDGSWRNGCFYTFGIASHRVENVGLTTAMAISALREIKRVRKALSN